MMSASTRESGDHGSEACLTQLKTFETLSSSRGDKEEMKTWTMFSAVRGNSFSMMPVSSAFGLPRWFFPSQFKMI